MLRFLFFLLKSQLFCQSSQLDSLFNAFDRNDNSEVLKTLFQPFGLLMIKSRNSSCPNFTPNYWAPFVLIQNKI